MLGDGGVPEVSPAEHPPATGTVSTRSYPGFGQALAAKPTSLGTLNCDGSCLIASLLPFPAWGVWWGT